MAFLDGPSSPHRPTMVFVVVLVLLALGFHYFHAHREG